MIFNPKQPRKFGPFTLHGLFMRRQSEVATAYSKMVADGLLNPQNTSMASSRGRYRTACSTSSQARQNRHRQGKRAGKTVPAVHDRHPALYRNEEPRGRQDMLKY